MGLKDKLVRYKNYDEMPDKQETPIAEKTVNDVRENNFENFIYELFSSLNINAMVETVLIYFMSRFDIDKAVIFFLDENDNVYKPIGIKGVNDFKDIVIDFDSYFLKLINNPIFLEAIQDETVRGEEINIFIKKGLGLVVPLKYKNEKTGFVMFGNKLDGSNLSDDDVTAINNVSNIIANALYNAISIENTKQKYDELSLDYKNMLTLIETLKNIQLAENIDEALTLFFNILKDIYKITAANLLLKDNSVNIFRTLKSIGLSPETDDLFEIKNDDDVIGDLIEIGESMMIPDFREMRIFEERVTEDDKKNISFFYTVPIKFGNECIGVFNVFNMDMEIVNDIPSWLERDLSYLPLSILPYLVNDLK